MPSAGKIKINTIKIIDNPSKKASGYNGVISLLFLIFSMFL